MQSRPSTDPGLITALHPISVRSPTIAPNFVRPVAMLPSGVTTAISPMIEFYVRENHAGAEMRVMAEDRIADVIKMRHLRFVEQNAILELARVAHHHAIAHDHVLAHVTAAAHLTIFADPCRTFQNRALLDDRARARQKRDC